MVTVLVCMPVYKAQFIYVLKLFIHQDISTVCFYFLLRQTGLGTGLQCRFNLFFHLIVFFFAITV